MSEKFQFPPLTSGDEVVRSRTSLESDSGYSTNSGSSSVSKGSCAINPTASNHSVVAIKNETNEPCVVNEFNITACERVKRRSRSRSRPRSSTAAYSDSVQQLKPSTPSSRANTIARRRQSDLAGNTNSIVLIDKKKLVRRQSAYIETNIPPHEQNEPLAEKSLVPARSKRRLSMTGSEWSEKNPRRSRRISTYVEMKPPPLVKSLSRARSKSKSGRHRKVASLDPASEEKQTTATEYVNEFIEEIWFVSLHTINRQSVMRFLVKWDSHPIDANTYEPLEHIRHCEVLEEYVTRKFNQHQEQIDALCARLLSEAAEIEKSFSERSKFLVLKALRDFDEIEFKCSILAYIYTYSGEVLSPFLKKLRYKNVVYQYYIKRKLELDSNAELLATIMQSENHSFHVTFENNVDFQPIPKFTYLPRVIYPREKVAINVGCKCRGKCGKASPHCCPYSKGWDFVFSEIDGRLWAKEIQMIVECNDFCNCSMSCPNRRKKISLDLLIFKSKNRGWGVKARENIPAGTFIMEYTGEFLNKSEASRRARKYHQTGDAYMFDLDYNDKRIAKYSIDATYRGNLSRFINHSCNPNLQTWPSTTCNEDPNMHKLYYFSQRFIRAGEELTIDYTGGRSKPKTDNEEAEMVNSKCYCGSKSCKGSIF